MVRERGYRGSPDHFRHLIACHRPRPTAEAYLRLRSLPGEQAQVDWGHFGHLADRPGAASADGVRHGAELLAPDLPALLPRCPDGELPARPCRRLRRPGSGVPRVLLYDNLKSAVLERRGDAIRFHPTLLGFAGHYRYEPRPVAVARGNEKGRVERAIRYVRDAFFAARNFTDLDDLNAQAEAWCRGPAADRRCPGRADTHRPRGVRRGSAAPAAAARQSRAAARAGRGQGRQDALCPLRSERLFGAPHPCAAHADGARRPARGAHRRWRATCSPAIARSYDKGAQIEARRPCPGPGRAEARRAASTAPPTASPRPPRPARTCCSCAPPNAAPISAPSPPALIRLLRPLWRRRVAGRHPRGAGARCAASQRRAPGPRASPRAARRTRHRSPSTCPRMCRRRDAPVRPHALETYDQLKERSDD